MIVKLNQLAQLGERKKNLFIQKTVSSIEKSKVDWVLGINKAEIEEFVSETVGFANAYNIYKESNLVKLIEYRVGFKFNLPLQMNLEKYLKESDLNEDKRIETFYYSLVSKSYELTEIYLSTPI